MAKARLPYFKWYAAEAETDDKYSAMTDAELGFYHRCLNKAWNNAGLPADPEERARVMKTPRKLADERWKRVGMCFEISSDDPSKVVNKRQEEERLEAIGKSDSSTRAVSVRELKKALSTASNDDRPMIVRSSTDDPRAYESLSQSKDLNKTIPFRKTEKPDSLGVWEHGEKFMAAWDRHGKNRGGESQQNVLQILIGMDLDWGRFERNHAPFCEYWAVEGWSKCAVTLLEWVQNGMMPPPARASPPLQSKFAALEAWGRE